MYNNITVCSVVYLASVIARSNPCETGSLVKYNYIFSISGYWRRYTGVLKKGRYVGLTTGSKQYYTRLARLGRGAANLTGRVLGFFYLGFLSPLITVPVNAIFIWEDFYFNYFKRFVDIYYYHGYAENWKAYALAYNKWFYSCFSLVRSP